MDFILILTVLLGLVVGSFLNVVIIRYPKMLKQQWKTECQTLLKTLPARKPTKLNLIRPRSHCVKCKKTLKPWHTIPVLSYFYLRGHCAYCQAKISPLYCIVEILTAAISVLVVLHFGLSYQCLFALLFSWGLIALSFIDFREHLLPDILTLGLLWLGLIANVFYFFTTSEYAILGAASGYTVLWVVAYLYQAVRKKQGLGHGDFKMLAMLGAWLGLSLLLNTLTTAVVLALIISTALLAFKKIAKQGPIPFGPYLALGGWLTFIYGPHLMNTFTRIF